MDNLISMLFNQLDEQNMAQMQQMMMDMPQMQEMMDNIHLNSSSSSSTTAADSSELKKQEEDFEQELALAKESEEYNRRTPIPCPLIDRATLLYSFNIRLREMKKTPGKGQFRTRKTWITGKAPCCTKPLTELKPIRLSQMKVPFVHEGHFLACRVLTESIVVVGTEVLIEDTQGRVHGISFYNFNADLNNSTWLKPGTIALLKEPYMKYSSIAKMPFLRVDSPSDVVFVHKTNRELLEWAGALCWFEPETLSAEELKKRGNAAFGREDFEEALDHYQRALALIGLKDEMAPVLHLNMAAALLELKRFPETVEEAKKALDGGANKEKALYRFGCASYGMRRWSESEAIGHFESALEVNPELSLTTDKLVKAKARLAESLTGKYDLKKLLEDEKRGQRFMDVADYCGPVKVADIPGKGKGLIVTEDVPKGTLLLAEKAYAIAFDNVDDFSLRSLCSVNLITKEANMSSNALCIIEAIQKLKREPQTANQLYGLYAGKQTSNIPTMEGVIDTGRIERICSLNCFNPRDDRKQSNPLELEIETESHHVGCALWILPSYANHSCLINTQPTFFGDLLMIRALIDFKKGDEVTVNYLSSLKTYEERHQGCAKKWGFQCECRLCELDRQEPPALAKERQKLAGKFAEELKKQRQLKWSKPGAALAKLLPLANAIRQTYQNRNELRTQMVGPLSILAYVYFQLNEPEKALEASKGILDSLGPQLMYSFVPVAYARMAEIYALRMRNHKMAKNTALKAYQMLQHKFGPMDKKLFLQMYPEFVPFM